VNETLAKLILGYVDHLEADDFWREVLATYSVAKLNATLGNVLGYDTDDVVSAALLFLRDLMLLAPEYGIRDEFRLQYDHSPLIARLHLLVESPSLHKRQQAVVTLGKTWVRDSVRFLEDVFIRRKEIDPILLDVLEFEIGWLRQRGDVNWVIKNCLGSASELTRWAGIDILDQRFKCVPGDEWWASTYEAVTAARDDEYLHAARCARFMREEMDLEVELANIESRAEIKRRKEELGMRRPLSFGFVAGAFKNRLHILGARDYTVADLRDFIEQRGSDLVSLCREVHSEDQESG